MGPKLPQYIYHLERAKLYYGRFNTTTNDIEYEIDLSKLPAKKADQPEQSNQSLGKIGEISEADMTVPVNVVNLTDSGFIFD